MAGQRKICSCGNEISIITTSCPKCGKTYIVKAIVTILIFLLIAAAIQVAMFAMLA